MTISPAILVELPMIHPLPTNASCATCTPSINKLLFPTIVRPLAAVPRLIVTFSRIRLLSPISAVDSSPRNLRSCGMAPITAPGKIVFPLPIREPYKILALAIILLLSPITTFLSINTKGAISTFSPILASGWIYAKGLIMLLNINYYLFFTICAMNSASQTTFSPTKAYPFMVEMPRRIGASSSTRKMIVSPGTTF